MRAEDDEVAIENLVDIAVRQTPEAEDNNKQPPNIRPLASHYTALRALNTLQEYEEQE
jgi:hypothetical protein